MYQFDHKLRVRYAETDQMGVVYYANYAIYCEVARVETLRSLGIPYHKLETEQGIMLPVIEHHANFLGAAYYDQELRIQTTIAHWPSVRISFDYQIFNQENKCIHKAHTVLVFTKKENMRPCKPPQILLETLAPYFALEK